MPPSEMAAKGVEAANPSTANVEDVVGAAAAEAWKAVSHLVYSIIFETVLRLENHVER